MKILIREPNKTTITRNDTVIYWINTDKSDIGSLLDKNERELYELATVVIECGMVTKSGLLKDGTHLIAVEVVK